MLTEVVIQTSNPTSLKIDDLDPDEILILKSISNLSSVKVNQFMGDFAREGSYYQGRRSERRNPVFDFMINPNYKLNIQASDVRELLYRMFMEPQRDNDAVQVLLKDDRKPDRYFIGYTETIEAEIFTKTQTSQVSLMTTDAYLRSAAISTATNPRGWFSVPLVYEGSADTGLEMSAEIRYNTDRVTFQNGNDIMVLNGTFLKGDVIHINTSQGERHIWHNGEDRMALLTSASTWIQLKEQGNVLKVYSHTPTDGLVVLTSYSYRAAWWGI